VIIKPSPPITKRLATTYTRTSRPATIADLLYNLFEKMPEPVFRADEDSISVPFNKIKKRLHQFFSLYRENQNFRGGNWFFSWQNHFNFWVAPVFPGRIDA
jgi:hypothetical protein